MHAIDSKEVKEALEIFENQEYYNTGMKHINGGFAEVDVFDHNEDYLYLELKWGEQDMVSGSSTLHTEQFKMDRETLEITD